MPFFSFVEYRYGGDTTALASELDKVDGDPWRDKIGHGLHLGYIFGWL